VIKSISEFYRPKVKICCISSSYEAEMALAHGADILGLVGPMPSGPGIIGNATIQQIAWSVPPALTFLLTSQTTAEGMIAHCRTTHTNCVQIVDSISFDTYHTIRTELPYLKIIQVVHVIDQTSINEAKLVAPYVDALLLDSGNPNLAVKELGGTGRIHHWPWSRAIVEQVDIPVFLAGGLNAENVAEAIQVVRPYGLDLCSSVRTNGQLDPNKLATFMRAVKLSVEQMNMQ
jgi:phosphoribosylanthranilate isomerase